MTDTIFLAGASGVVGQILAPMLIENGYKVYGTTRHADRSAMLDALGVIPVVVDVYDKPALERAMLHARPTAVIHQLTALPDGLDPSKMGTALADNARIRDEGTRNLVAAAIAAGATTLIAQSIAWAYRPGNAPYAEDHPLDLDADEPRAITVRGVAALERHVRTAPLSTTVLRYGRFYGPGTGIEAPPAQNSVHIEAAAFAAWLALRECETGIFNIADDGSDVTSEKARRAFGWRPELRVQR